MKQRLHSSLSSKVSKFDVLYKNLKTGKLIYKSKDMIRNVEIIHFAQKHKSRYQKTPIWIRGHGGYLDNTKLNFERLKKWADKK